MPPTVEKKGIRSLLRNFVRGRRSSPNNNNPTANSDDTSITAITAVPVSSAPTTAANVVVPIAGDTPAVTLSSEPSGSSIPTAAAVDNTSTNTSTNNQDTSASSIHVSVGLNGVTELLKVIRDSSDVFTPLKSITGGIVACIDVYRRTSGNHDEMERLLATIDRLSWLVVARLEREPKATRQGIENLARTLDVEHKKIKLMTEHGILARLAQSTHDAEELVASCRSIKDALDEFQLELGLALEQNTHAILKNVVFQNLRRSELAAFTAAINSNTVTRGPCTAGTRVGIIQGIFDWAVSDDASTAPVYWLNGLAGTGKTTIAYTMCQRLEVTNIPFVSFFCSRQLDSRDTTLLIPTICRDLAELFQSYASEVVPVLEKDSKLARAVLPLQINKLLARPWKESLPQRDGIRAPVVVVDALDESDTGSEFLQELLRVVHDGALPGIKFLVTSRADPDVVKLCESFPRGAVCHLHEVDTHEVEEDIAKFVVEKLPNLRGKPELEIVSQRSGGLFIYAATIVRYLSPRTALSTQEQLKQLRALLGAWPNSSGKRETLLVDRLYQQVLANAFTYVDDDIQWERISVLHTILCAEHPLPIPVITDLASETHDEEMVSNVINSLHAAIYVSAKDACVYWYHQSFADFVFSSDRANFILSDSSLEKIQFNAHCESSVRHAILATSSFRIMQGLQFNICELESSFLLDRNVPDLEERANQKISQALRYASKHWASHLHKAASSYIDSLHEALRDFLHNRLLFWMEALNLIGAKSVYHGQVYLLQEWLKQVPSKDLTEYATDVSRFITYFTGSPASLSTPHLYISSLATWDPSSAVSATWRPSFQNLPQFLRPQGVSALPLISVHTDTLSRHMIMALSGDGARIATSQQNSVRIWDATTGESLRQLNGHTDQINDLAMSHDGSRAVSTSSDCSVKVWDTTTGEQLRSLDNLGLYINAPITPLYPTSSLVSIKSFVMFPRDGNLVVFVLDERSLKKWEESMATAEQTRILSRDGSPVLSTPTEVSVSLRLLDRKMVKHMKDLHSLGHFQLPVFALSSDGTIGAYGSRDYVMVLNIAAKKLLSDIQGHTGPVTSVALSDDGTILASGSYDRTVRVWNVATRKQLRKLDGHIGSVHSVALSHNGIRIASAADSFIRVWDGTGKQKYSEMEGHSDEVLSVGLSGDKSRIVSSSKDRCCQMLDVNLGGMKSGVYPDHVRSVAISQDGHRLVMAFHHTLCVWDLVTRKQLRQSQCHTNWITSVAISLDGNTFVSGSADCSVRVWDMSTGERRRRFEGHTNWVNSVAISPDGILVVSGSDDRSIRIWDVTAGKLLRRLTGHTKFVTSVALSRDCSRIASGSEDSSVRLWDAATGDQLLHITGHTDVVRSVALSQDGTSIVSGSNDHSVRIWDGVSGSQMKQLDGHFGRVTTVALSSDDTTIVSGADDQSVRVWEDLTTNLPWLVDKDGWILHDSNRVMWISAELRQLFLHPHCALVISRRGYSKVDFTHSDIGTHWHKCYTP